jgi:preprotein translocase SecE subunit
MAKEKDTVEQPKITRLKAKDDSKSMKQTDAEEKKVVTASSSSEPKKNIVKRFFGYFKGAWFELRQVRWPNRRATLSMTAALLIFTAIFAVFILLIDLAWEYLFNLILL